ncbi:MAG TPA: UDP-N-acetylmuramate dehydrogenase [Bacillota bacterium]|nr:UDP-N-acetylmuramate dehydrogenase [Bacillota bacterium]
MLQELNRRLSGVLIFDEPMSRHTSFRVGGPADALFVPRDLGELKRCLRETHELGLPVTIIGNGSNLLVCDGGIRGLVIKLSGTLDWIHISASRVRAGCGVLLSTLAYKTVEAGLGGLEFAAGIPGTLGGGVIMNAGAYGGEMKDVVTSVRALLPTGKECEFSAAEMNFGYRCSSMQNSGMYVLEVVMELKPSNKEESMAIIRELNDRRKAKQPLALPSAGSVFKRPVGYYAGPLIESAGLKGVRIGDAEVSTLHANFIVNVGNASAADVLALIAHVKDTVYREFGVSLEQEVKVIGEQC